MPEDLKTEVRNIVQEAVIKIIPKKKKCKKRKWLSEEALQIAEKRNAYNSSVYTNIHILTVRIISRVFHCDRSYFCKKYDTGCFLIMINVHIAYNLPLVTFSVFRVL